MPIIECGFPNVPDPVTTLSAIGPTVLVDIGFDPAMFAQGLPPALGTPALPTAIPAVQVLALLDTGAQQSCIDEVLAQQLGLPLIDQQQMSGVGGPTIFNVYLAHINIPGLVVQYGRFTGVHLQAGGQYHRALIGRTLLNDALVVYDGRSGSVKFAR
ncbi:MAG: retroviral-like aspartic protease family protein [Candidatus Binatia bacterium]